MALPPNLHPEAAAYGLPAAAVRTYRPNRGHPNGSRPTAVTEASEDTVVQRWLTGEPVLFRSRELAALASDWRPDLVLWDSAELGGCLAGEVLGIPHVSIQVSATGAGRWGQDQLARALAGHRMTLGLPADPELASLHRYLHVNLMPPAYEPDAALKPNARYYRQVNPERAGERLPPWLARLSSERPLVFASLGTNIRLADTRRLTEASSRVDTLVRALTELDCSAIIAAGWAGDNVAFPAEPDRINVVDEVPQPLLLQCCDLFITHGGFNSVRESLRLGVPMVVTPMFGDQPTVARACERLGVAHALTTAPPTVDVLTRGCKQVLTNIGYRARTRTVQREILALPPLDTLIDDLEDLVS